MWTAVSWKVVFMLSAICLLCTLCCCIITTAPKVLQLFVISCGADAGGWWGGCLQFLERGSGKLPAVLLLCM